MAAYNFHREIMEDPANVTEVAEICSFECDPKKNPTGNCIPICSIVCPLNCNTSDSYPPPQSPPPPPPIGSYVISLPPKHHHSALSLPLKISLVILVLTFSLFLLYTLYKFYTVWYRSRRRRSPPSPENQETHDEFLDHDILDHPIWYIRTIGLQPSVISAITVVKYSKTDGLIDGTNCSVCLSDFQEDETLRLLPKCNHAFHISCIDTWLRSHTNCPLCRAGIVKNTTNSSTSDQNLGDSDHMEENEISVTVTEEVNGEQRQRDDDNQSSELRIGVVDEEDKAEIDGGSGTNDFLIIRRSVSLNDYAACRIRSDIHNNYYSDRHEFQLQSLHGELGLEVIKVEQSANNFSRAEK